VRGRRGGVYVVGLSGTCFFVESGARFSITVHQSPLLCTNVHPFPHPLQHVRDETEDFTGAAIFIVRGASVPPLVPCWLHRAWQWHG
jgi:hypothetical protein